MGILYTVFKCGKYLLNANCFEKLPNSNSRRIKNQRDVNKIQVLPGASFKLNVSGQDSSIEGEEREMADDVADTSQ